MIPPYGLPAEVDMQHGCVRDAVRVGRRGRHGPVVRACRRACKRRSANLVGLDEGRRAWRDARRAPAGASRAASSLPRSRSPSCCWSGSGLLMRSLFESAQRRYGLRLEQRADGRPADCAAAASGPGRAQRLSAIDPCRRRGHARRARPQSRRRCRCKAGATACPIRSRAARSSIAPIAAGHSSRWSARTTSIRCGSSCSPAARCCDTDTAGAPPVAVINEALAKREFPDEDPIGQRILVQEIVPGKTELGSEIRLGDRRRHRGTRRSRGSTTASAQACTSRTSRAPSMASA